MPRGIELLIKKAAVDPQFRELLLEKRAEAAKTIGLELRPSEIAMLSDIPQAQLEAIISRTRVDSKVRPILKVTAVATVTLAALAGLMLPSLGSRPDRPQGLPDETPPGNPATTNPNPVAEPSSAADTDAVINPKPPAKPGDGGQVR